MPTEEPMPRRGPGRGGAHAVEMPSWSSFPHTPHPRYCGVHWGMSMSGVEYGHLPAEGKRASGGELLSPYSGVSLSLLYNSLGS